MNIIIEQDKHVRLTQYSNQATYNLEDIVFYISKTLLQTNPMVILKLGLNTYPFLLAEEEQVNEFYYIYKIMFTSNVSLQAREYIVEIKLNENIIPIGNIQFNQILYTTPQMFTMRRSTINEAPLYGLTDEHLPVDIDVKTRIINMPSNNGENTLVSGDNRSQIIRFRIPKIVDDRTDITVESKTICIDYKIDNIIASDEVDRSTYNQEEIDGIIYLIIPWVIENKITNKAGMIEFALSVTGSDGYVWQTLPATLNIKKGLGRDFKVPINSPTADPTYDEVLDFVRNIDYISDINTEENTITKVTREAGKETVTQTVPMSDLLDNDEGEIIFSGGGALE